MIFGNISKQSHYEKEQKIVKEAALKHIYQ